CPLGRRFIETSKGSSTYGEGHTDRGLPVELVWEALYTAGGMFWKALWALIFGYTISAGIQVLVTREQMATLLGDRCAKQTGLAAFFGFISSSCSFAALAASRSVFFKGAHPANALAFLIA